MVLSLALARIRFAVWFSSTKLDVPQPFEPVFLPPVAPDSMGPLDDFSQRTVTPSIPYTAGIDDEEPTWEDAEWQ